MFKLKNGMRSCCLVIVSMELLFGTAISAGCKKEPSESSPRPNSPPGQAAETSAGREPGQSASAPGEAVTGSKKSLTSIVRAARTWEPAREFSSLVGTDAPDFKLTDITDKQHRLSDYKGKNVMIVFWATWCPPCRMEVPHLIELRNAIGKDKLAILAISHVSQYPPNTAEMIKQFATDRKINYTVFAAEPGSAGGPYDAVRELPTIFFIDPKGKIKLVAAGLMHLDEVKAVLEADWP